MVYELMIPDATSIKAMKDDDPWALCIEEALYGSGRCLTMLRKMQVPDTMWTRS